MNRPKTSSETQNRGSLPRLVRAFRVQGDLTDKTLDELCDEIETLAHEMRQAKHIRHATTIMHLAADAVVTYGANEKADARRFEQPKDQQ